MSPCLPKQLVRLFGWLKAEGLLLGLADVFLVGSAEGVPTTHISKWNKKKSLMV
jgi:hypothetical protein